MNRYDALLEQARPIAEADLRSDDKMQAIARFSAITSRLRLRRRLPATVDPDSRRQLLVAAACSASISPAHIAIKPRASAAR
ncbi:MAG: hypothetical protein IPH09_10730 [bacterium]|nr:hypothetical protein [bacterium]